MTINYTTLLALAKPVTGTETGQWGDVVNDQITSMLEDAVANAATFSVTSGNVTLTTANGSTSQARMSTLIITGTPGTTRNVIAPSQAKIYVVINQSNGAVVIKGAATTGVTVGAGQTAQVAWNGSDFVEIGNYVHGNFVINGNLTVNGNTTLGDAVGDTLTVNATITSNLLFTDNTYDIGASGATRPRNLFLAGNATMTGTLTVDSTTDSSSTTTGSIQTDGGLGVAKALFVGTTADIAGAVTLSGGTANGVAYLNGSKVLTTGSALTFDGTNFGVGGAASTKLHVQTTGADVEVRASTFTSGNVRFGFDASGAVYNWIQTERSSGALQFAIGNAEQMRLTSTGLGIGTSSPATKLDVVGAISASLGLILGAGNNLTWGGAYGAGIPTIAGSSGTLLFYPTGSTSGESMRLDSSGNLGIGTSSPGAKLDIGGTNNTVFFKNSGATTGYALATVSNTGGAFQYGVANSTGTFWGSGNAGNYSVNIGSTSATNLGFGTSDTLRMTLDASGNLGLGVTPSAWVSGAKAIQAGGYASFGQMRAGTSDAAMTWNAVVTSGTNSGTGYVYRNTGDIASSYEQNGAHRWYTAPSGTAGNAITFTQAMTLDASGNLLLNTTSQYGSQKLSVNGGIALDGRSAATPGLSEKGDDNTGIFWPAADTLGFSTGGSERARITSGGDLLVGTTNTSGSAGVGTKIRYDASSPDISIVCSTSTNSSSAYNLYSTGAGAFRFYVGLGGTIFATSTTISAISDQRLKENIRDLDAGLDKIMALKPRKFDWKSGKGKDIKGDRGWIAQEFEQVFPDLIDEWKDPAPEGEEPYKSVRADLIPVLVKAIQELKADLDATKAELAALKGA
jgi:hypothetical protein